TNTITEDSEALARYTRYSLAKAEFAALSEWKKNGEQGERPATPNLDAMNAEKQSGAKPMSTTNTTKKASRPEAGSIRFWHNGKPLADIDNFVSRLAYDDTRGMGVNGGTMKTAELVDLLAAAGITDPNHTTWEYEVQPGRWIGAVLKGDEVPENLA